MRILHAGFESPVKTARVGRPHGAPRIEGRARSGQATPSPGAELSRIARIRSSRTPGHGASTSEARGTRCGTIRRRPRRSHPMTLVPRLVLACCALIPLSALGGCRAAEHEPRRGEAPSTVASSGARDVAPRPWEHATSDVPVDPRIHFGALDNGLRWAWARNGEPQKRCYLRLHVDVGSLAEEEDELGLAHFLEPLAFNGSAHFPAGTLIEWFQKHGMAFGADTNAHTSFSETVYKLDLPNADEATLREGLRVLRDFADGLLLAQEEIDREKGVIDGEERERDSAGWRVFLRELDELYAGTRVAVRLPIGKHEVRAGFTSASIGSFYRKWYRPDAMTLVAVGDLGALDPAPLFTEFFGSMRAPDSQRPEEPPIGRAARFDRVL